MGFLPLLVPLDGGSTEELFEHLGWPPGVESFAGRPLLPGVLPDWVTNTVAQAIIGAILVIIMWLVFARKQTIVPSRRQFAGEFLYDIVRNGIGRDILGPDFRPYLPYLLGLISFIIVNNFFGEFFFFMFPTFSHIAYPYALAIMSWLLYIIVGIKRFGVGHYFKKMLIPEGVPVGLYPLIIPLEFISNFIVRPVTLALRLFANMFAGHLVIMVFVIGGTLLIELGGPLIAAGSVSLIMSFAIFALELFVGALQAYIFTVLTAQYVSSSIAEGH
ncbi:MAG: F0F1 ATP synthase subunit A [Propionibacteriaceae bacterium]|jgi:F-type H+-transporting ATPase subunit a|nr:F0F1 ATP synthase subunit A [Propionibacteriaceae bacterium]